MFGVTIEADTTTAFIVAVEGAAAVLRKVELDLRQLEAREVLRRADLKPAPRKRGGR